jgi:hypothetical protein
VQTEGVLDVTDLVPSPFVLTDAVKPTLKTGLAGMLVIVGDVGVPWPTKKDCGFPSAASKLMLAAVCAVNVHIPTAT